VYTSKYVASNQAERADNVFTGTNQQKIDKLRQDIRGFKQQVETVVVLWTANTEESVGDIESEEELDRLIASEQEV
jgi:myo-inositol-1-phosphate synthase